MLTATGVTTTGSPMVVLGLSQAESVRLLAAGLEGPLVIDVQDLDPRFPQLRIVLAAGETDVALRDALTEMFPAAWRLDAPESGGG